MKKEGLVPYQEVTNKKCGKGELLNFIQTSIKEARNVFFKKNEHVLFNEEVYKVIYKYDSGYWELRKVTESNSSDIELVHYLDLIETEKN
jgi:hypothetical protein